MIEGLCVCWQVTDNTEVEFEVTHVVCASRQWQLRQPSSYNSAMGKSLVDLQRYVVGYFIYNYR